MEVTNFLTVNKSRDFIKKLILKKIRTPRAESSYFSFGVQNHRSSFSPQKIFSRLLSLIAAKLMFSEGNHKMLLPYSTQNVENNWEADFLLIMQKANKCN